MRLTAQNLVLDVLSALRRGPLPVRALVDIGALFGFAENNIRVSLSKLCAEGRAARDERGSYRLSPEAEAAAAELLRWRDLDGLVRPWDGAWVAVHCSQLSRGAPRRRRETALELLGFAELERGLYLRPDNLTFGVDGIRDRFLDLAGAGDGDDPAVLVYGMHALDAAADHRARNLWDAAGLTRGYHAALEQLDRSRVRLEQLAPAEALVEVFLVGGEIVHRLIVDPLLPSPMLDPEPRAALVDSLRDYGEMGYAMWAPFVDRYRARPQGPVEAALPVHGAAPAGFVRAVGS